MRYLYNKMVTWFLNDGEALQMTKSDLSLLDIAVRYIVKQDDNPIPKNTF